MAYAVYHLEARGSVITKLTEHGWDCGKYSMGIHGRHINSFNPTSIVY